MFIWNKDVLYRHGNITHSRRYPPESAPNLTSKLVLTGFEFEFEFEFSPIIKYGNESGNEDTNTHPNSSPNLFRLLYYVFYYFSFYNLEY